MRVLTFGSLNIDHVYKLEKFVQPGQTLSSHEYQRFSGGKGLNQSVALARAGANVYHAGKVGQDGLWLKTMLEGAGVKTDYTEVVDSPSGHAIIQVDKKGENAIIIHGGANQTITPADAENVIKKFSNGDFLLLQNEISATAEIMKIGHKAGMKLVFNAAPFGPEVLDYPLELVDIFIINEIEGRNLTGETKPDNILEQMIDKFPKAATLLTLSKRGAIYRDSGQNIQVPAKPVTAVDTTGAGDTFIGYFLAGISKNDDIEKAVKQGCDAAAICVTRPGASSSIPTIDELEC